MIMLHVNGSERTLDAPAEMPLLWALRDVLGLTGTKFGCGIAQCGACTVHVDGTAVRSCQLPIGVVGNHSITTIEAIGDHRRRRAAGRLDAQRRIDVPQDPKDFKLIGHAVKRLDAPAKVDASARFGIDVMLTGMKIATLRASPVVGGKLRQADSAAALQVRGVRQVVLLDDIAAVVGDDMWAVKQGLAALRVEWDDGGDLHATQAQLWAGLEDASRGPGVTAQKTGDAAGRLARGDAVEASYELPFLAHAPMEPMNCTVHVTAGACEIWVGTQAPGFAQAGAAKVLGLQPAQVTIHNHLIGGGFGRRLEVDGVIKATRIAQKVDGPVKVVWTREEDIRRDVYRPMYHDRLRAVVESGRVTAWHHRVTGPSILARWLPPGFRDGIDPDAIEGAVKPAYDFGNVLVEYVRHETPVVTVGFWRGVGPNSNVFSAECFLDLLARKNHLDPLAFRKRMLQVNPRALRVLELAAAKAGWGEQVRPVDFGPDGFVYVGGGSARTHGPPTFLQHDVGGASDEAFRVAGSYRRERLHAARGDHRPRRPGYEHCRQLVPHRQKVRVRDAPAPCMPRPCRRDSHSLVSATGGRCRPVACACRRHEARREPGRGEGRTFDELPFAIWSRAWWQSEHSETRCSSRSPSWVKARDQLARTRPKPPRP